MFLAVLTPPTRCRALICLPTLPFTPLDRPVLPPALAAALWASSHQVGYSGMGGATKLQARKKQGGNKQLGGSMKR